MKLISFRNYLKNIDAVTPGDVQRVARRYLDSSTTAVVVIGDIKAIRSGIERTNFGMPIRADVNGNPIPQ